MSEELFNKLFFGKYEILNLIGNGAFGYVYNGKI